jgi:hypothetical protein
MIVWLNMLETTECWSTKLLWNVNYISKKVLFIYLKTIIYLETNRYTPSDDTQKETTLQKYFYSKCLTELNHKETSDQSKWRDINSLHSSKTRSWKRTRDWDTPRRKETEEVRTTCNTWSWMGPGAEITSTITLLSLQRTVLRQLTKCVWGTETRQ